MTPPGSPTPPPGSAPRADTGGLPLPPAAPGHLTMVLRQVDYHWTRLRRTWKGSVVTAIVNPLMYVLAMGLVLGRYIDQAGTGPAGAPSYLHFIAAGLLAGQAMTIAIGDATYPIYGAIKWDRTFWAMVATPLRVSDIVTATLAAIVVRVALSCAVFMLALAPFGVFRSVSGALGAFVVQLVIATAFAAPVCAFSMWTTSEAAFAIVFRVVLIPLFLFSGAFFPTSNLGPVLERLVTLSPLWHGIELTRALMLGTPLPAPVVLLHVGVLTLLSVAGWWLAVRILTRRLLS